MLVHDLPWWVTVIVAGITYGFMREIAPHLMQDNIVAAPIMQRLPQVAWMALLLFLGLAGLNLWVRILKRFAARRSAKSHEALNAKTLTVAVTPECPSCRTPMVMRVARRGPQAGNQFWGCTSYPGCKATRSL